MADARLAEAVGFALVGVADSQSVFREMYTTMALCAQATQRVLIGPTVTNPITRHPAVAASGIATIDAVEQLTRYLERMADDPGLASCRGVLAASVVKPQARVLAEARGFAVVEVDYDDLRGLRADDLRLF